RHTRSKRDWSSDVCSSDLQRQLTLIFSQKREQNKQLQQRLIQTHPRKKISNAKQELDNLTDSLTKNRQQMMQQKRQQLQTMLDKLALLNPLYIMNKGFSVAYKQDWTIVKRTNQVQLEEHIDVALMDRKLACSITGMRSDKDE